MALIKCPECKKKISDQCENCPQCGYPIKNILQVANAEELSENTVILRRKPFYKKPWVWIVAGVALAAIIVGLIFLLTHNTKPKLDKEGNPVFVELTTEVYTNAKEYKGYHINIKGQVFQVMSDNGNIKGIQIWLDPDTCEQNMMVYYNTDVEVKQGDYIICTGYIDSVSKYKNAYGATLYAPLVISSDLKQATYIEVMAPTTATITPENLKQEKFGYSISVDKVEFSKKETRVYVTATNNGKAKLYFGEAVIVQEGRQYKETDNSEAAYDEIPYELLKDAFASGIIVFPPMDAKDFELSISIHSDDFEENLGEYSFIIRKETSAVKESMPPKEADEEEPTTPPTTQSETPKNRNQEAISAAINVANRFFPTNRQFVESVLINPSLEEGFKAFSVSEAEYAIITASIDWKSHAAADLSQYSDICGFWTSPSDLVHNWLENYSSFTDDELEYAINNCNVDWNVAAKENVHEFADKDTITRAQVATAMQNSGYTKSQVDYGINNSDFDWSSQVDYYITTVLNNQNMIKYTHCPNCYWIYGVYEICPFCGEYTDIYETSSYTKEQVIDELKNVGFTDVEIGRALRYYGDSYFYNESDYKKP